MIKNESTFISFRKDDSTFVAYIPMKQFFSSKRDIEKILKEAAELYKCSILNMQSLISEMNTFRNKNKYLPARKMWELGNLIFELVQSLKRLSLQIDSIYSHLMRDLGVKREWLEKVIIFRRYLPSKQLIPESLNWGCCRDKPRYIAKRLKEGMPPN